MRSSTLILKHDRDINSTLASVARLFRSQVTIEFNEHQINLKSPESWSSVLGINSIALQQGTELKLDIDGDDQDIAFRALLAYLNGSTAKSIWQEHFDRLYRASEFIEARVIVPNGGVHARPAAYITKLATSFDAEILFCYEHGWISARDILGMLMVLAPLAPGTEIRIIAFGQGTREALVAMEQHFSKANLENKSQ